MAAEPEILEELRRLRARVPQLTGALAASVDGLVLGHDTPGVEPESVAALTATALGVALRMTEATGRGPLRELLVRGGQGYVATYAAGRTAVLTLLAEDRVNVGRLHLEGRRAGARIGELVDAETAPTPDSGRAGAGRAGTGRPAAGRPGTGRPDSGDRAADGGEQAASLPTRPTRPPRTAPAAPSPTATATTPVPRTTGTTSTTGTTPSTTSTTGTTPGTTSTLPGAPNTASDAGAPVATES
jgi:predicted regulator of Ras-like GTPase activity (Roadblock/LC7/MglB family)